VVKEKMKIENYMNKSINDYAESLFKNGLCSSAEEAMDESIRWHVESNVGFVEPLLCSHRVGIDYIETEMDII
jgi:hypothetical protein